jgi:hypothetical protein
MKSPRSPPDVARGLSVSMKSVTAGAWARDHDGVTYRTGVRIGKLEHVPRQLNQEDSHGAQDGRIYRH